MSQHAHARSVWCVHELGAWLGGYRVGILGGYTGWVYGWVLQEYYPATALSPPADQRPEGAGPRSAGVGRKQGGRPLRVPYPGAHPAPVPPTPAPLGLPGPASLYRDLLAGKGRDSWTFPEKLVKTTKCHRRTSKRPVIVPIFQNASRKSPLEIPRFPFSAAFSHKELMVLF